MTTMETRDQLESIAKLRQRLIRLIRLGEPNPLRPSVAPNETVDLTEQVEECVRRLFNTSSTIDGFVQDVQRLLNVTIKTNLTVFLFETIPIAQEYLRQQNCDPYSWDTFKALSIEVPTTNLPSTSTTRLPSLQQARFRLPSTCPQLIDFAASTLESTTFQPQLRPDADPYQQKLIYRFAYRHFYLNQCGEELILQTLYRFLHYIIERMRFYIRHRIDRPPLDSDQYETTSNTREQIRFLIDLHKLHQGSAETTPQGYPSSLQKLDWSHPSSSQDEEQKRSRVREQRLSAMEELRHREADETANLVLRETRIKRQKLMNKDGKTAPPRILRATLQDLILVMENEPKLKRSKTLLFAYANR